jgi:putative ABC transport system permease protein
METLIQDVRHAVRTLARTPMFVAVAVLTLTLGIGANLAIFTVVNAVLLQPLPFHDPERLVRVFDDLRGGGARDVGMSIPEMDDLRSKAGVFTDVAGLIGASTALSGGDRVERIELLGTTPNYFQMLGSQAALGRVYTQAEWAPGFLDGVVISDALWRRQFGADPHVIGKRIRVDEDPYTIIGVMPPDFRHPGNTLNGDVDIWGASGFSANPFPSPPIRGARFLNGVLARLKPGVTLEQAQRSVDALVAQLQRAYPNDYPPNLKWAIRLEPAQTSLTGNIRPTLLILLAAVGVVLLVACVNVASLLIARSSARSREFAIRQAIGASRQRLVRQVLTESLLLALAGGVAAVVCLWIAKAWLLAMVPSDIPRLAEVRTDWRMLLIALGLSVAAGVLFGVTPALHASGFDPARALREGGRSDGSQSVRQRRSRATLVVLEVALSVVLLVGTGLLIRSFSAVLQQRPGFNPEHLTIGQVWVPVPNNPSMNQYLTPPQQAALARRLLDRLATLPGVQHAALATSRDIPMLGTVNNPRPFGLPDETVATDSTRAAQFGSVSAGYFDALGIPVKKGRAFTDHDDANAPNVVVVNEAFVRKFSSGRDAVGRRVRLGRGVEFEIVGVVGDVHMDGLDATPQPRIYLSVLQRPGVEIAVFLRTQSDVRTTREALIAAVKAVDPELPVYGVRTMEQLMTTSMARRRFSLALMSVFGLSALLLAALGIYGVMAFLVSQRTQEFGVRLALGAVPSDILRLALRPGLALTITGTAIGLAVSLVVIRLMSALIYGVSATDPMTFLAVPAVLVLVTLVACFIPARRASRVSAVVALR